MILTTKENMILQQNEEYFTLNNFNKVVQIATNKARPILLDKTETGCGMTYLFLNLLQPQPNKKNILIVPNTTVASSKQYAFNQLVVNRKEHASTSFHFSTREENRYSYDKSDISVFVADTFLTFVKEGLIDIDNVDVLLVDESHQLHISAKDRPKIVELDSVLKSQFKSVKVIYGTATPIFDNSDVKVVFNHLKYKDKQVVNVFNNENILLQNIADLKDKNENVLIFTNNKNIIKKVSTDSGRRVKTLKARFEVGDSLFKSINTIMPIEIDNRSNIVICSSKAYEGFDLSSKYHVFIFIDAAMDYSFAYPQQVKQAISRPRNGTLSVNLCYCKLTKEKSTKKHFNSLNPSNIISEMNKTNSLDYSAHGLLKEVVEFEVNDEDYSIKVAENTNVVELLNYNKFITDNEDNYFNELKRFNITLKDKRVSKDKNIRISTIKNSLTDIHNNLFKNNREGLFEKDSYINFFNNLETESQSIYNFIKLFIKKNSHLLSRLYSKDELEQMIFDLLDVCADNERKSVKIILNYANKNIKLDKRATKELQELFSIKVKTNYTVEDFKAYANRYYKKRKSMQNRFSSYGKKEIKAYNEKINSKQLNTDILNLITSCASNKLIFKRKQIGFRNFNLVSNMSSEIFDTVIGYFGFIAHRFDISKASPRILYAINGTHLPTDIYGNKDAMTKDQYKESKAKLNTMLNNIAYNPVATYKSGKKISKKEQKRKTKNSLLKYEIEPSVVEWLMDNCFEANRNKTYYAFTYHEQKIIDKAYKLVKSQFDDLELKNISITTLHDELVVISKVETNIDIEQSCNNVLGKDFNYLEQYGWFTDVTQKELDDMAIQQIMFDEWIESESFNKWIESEKLQHIDLDELDEMILNKFRYIQTKLAV